MKMRVNPMRTNINESLNTNRGSRQTFTEETQRLQLANFAAQVGQTLAETDAKIRQLEAHIERNGTTHKLSPGAELARLKALREHQAIADTRAGAQRAESRRAGFLVPDQTPPPEPPPSLSGADAGAARARARQKGPDPS